MSKIEKEIVEAIGKKRKDGEDRQRWLRRMLSAIQGLDEDVWNGLSVPAQKWANVGQAVVNDGDEGDEIKDFKDYKAPAEDEADEEGDEDVVEDEAPPKKKGKPKAEEADEEAEEEEAPPKKKGDKKPKAALAAAEEDEEEEPAPKKKPARGKAEPEDEEEEEIEVKKPAKKGAKETKAPAKKTAAKKPAKKVTKPAKEKKEKVLEGPKFDATKMVIKNPSLTAAEIVEKLGGKKAGVSEITVAAVRANVRHTLLTLKALDLLDDQIKI